MLLKLRVYSSLNGLKWQIKLLTGNDRILGFELKIVQDSLNAMSRRSYNHTFIGTSTD